MLPATIFTWWYFTGSDARFVWLVSYGDRNLVRYPLRSTNVCNTMDWLGDVSFWMRQCSNGSMIVSGDALDSKRYHGLRDESCLIRLKLSRYMLISLANRYDPSLCLFSGNSSENSDEFRLIWHRLFRSWSSFEQMRIWRLRLRR